MNFKTFLQQRADKCQNANNYHLALAEKRFNANITIVLALAEKMSEC